MMAFSAGFIVGAMVASVIAVFVMAAFTAPRIADLQDRIDELELGR